MRLLPSFIEKINFKKAFSKPILLSLLLLVLQGAHSNTFPIAYSAGDPHNCPSLYTTDTVRQNICATACITASGIEALRTCVETAYTAQVADKPAPKPNSTSTTPATTSVCTLVSGQYCWEDANLSPTTKGCGATEVACATNKSNVVAAQQAVSDSTKKAVIGSITSTQLRDTCTALKNDTVAYNKLKTDSAKSTAQTFIDTCAGGGDGGVSAREQLYSILLETGSTVGSGIPGLTSSIAEQKKLIDVKKILGDFSVAYTFREKAAELEKKQFKVGSLPGFSGNLEGLFSRIIQIVAYTAGSIGVLLWIYESFLVIQGNDPSIQRYRKKIQNIAIGLVVIFGAYLIVSAIITIVYNL